MKTQVSLTDQLTQLTSLTKEFRQTWNDMRLEAERVSQESLDSFQSFIKGAKLNGKSIEQLINMGFELSGHNDTVSRPGVNRARVTRVWEVEGEVTALSTRTVCRMDDMSPIGYFTVPFNVKFPDGKIGKMQIVYRAGSTRIYIKKRTRW